MYDVIIIGGGPAGFTAALYASRARLRTLLIEKKFFGGQMATTYEMENYPGFEDPIHGSDLAERMANQAKRFGTEVIQDEVIEVTLDQVNKIVKTNNGIYQTKTVILCMGASPRELGLPDERRLRGAGISYCATCDGAFFKDMNVAVIGGGDTAAEDALYLARFCSKVYLIHRRDSMRATKIMQELVLSHPKIELKWNSVVDKIIGDEEVRGIRIRNLKTNESSDLDVSGVFIAIGIVPNTEIIEGKIDLNDAGFVITDDSMQTNMFGVYSAGDVREKLLRQVITAASDGAVASYVAEKYISENKW